MGSPFSLVAAPVLLPSAPEPEPDDDEEGAVAPATRPGGGN